MTGATGFVGAEVLKQLVADPGVTKITCVTRREIDNSSPKMRAIIQPDFLHYADGLLEELAAHDGCIPWEKLTRHLKGRTEKDLKKLQDEYADFYVCSFRPGGILPDVTPKWWHGLLGFMTVRVDVLAKGMIAAVKSRDLFRKQQLVTNGEIKQLGR